MHIQKNHVYESIHDFQTTKQLQKVNMISTINFNHIV